MLEMLLKGVMVLIVARLVQMGIVEVVSKTDGDSESFRHFSFMGFIAVVELLFWLVPTFLVEDQGSESTLAVGITIAGFVIFADFLLSTRYQLARFYVASVIYTIVVLHSAFKVVMPENLSGFAVITFVAVTCLIISFFRFFFFKGLDLEDADAIDVSDDLSDFVDGISRVMNTTLFTTLLILEAALVAGYYLFQLWA